MQKKIRKNKLSILLIDEDEQIQHTIKKLIQHEDYKLYVANNGQEGLELCTSLCPELILMDIDLGDVDGMKIIELIRDWSDVPIIIISDYCDCKRKVACLYKGADDYITKPFEPEELKARVYAAARRRGNHDALIPYLKKDLNIDFNKREVMLRGKKIHFSPVEYRILEFLAMNSGKVVSYRMLMEKIWGPYAICDNKILRVYMTNIRHKIERDPSNPEYLFTENRIGYRMLECSRRREVGVV